MRTTAPDGTEIAWEVTGPTAGPPLVLLHSLGADGGMWEPQVAALSDRYRVLTPDLRGHGRSDVPAGDYPVEALAADVLAVADAEALDRFSVCGISLGGVIALWLAIHAGDRITSLIASNTGAKVGTAEGWGERAASVRTDGLRPLTEASVARWFSPDFGDRHPDRLRRFVEAFHATDPEGYAGCCAALGHTDLREEVAGIGCPTLVIAGGRDEAAPPALSEWLHAHIRGSRLVVLDDAAHLANLDRPEAFGAALDGFLQPAGT